MQITPAQIRAARGLVQMSQSQLAVVAFMSKSGLGKIEAGLAEPRMATLNAIRKALEAAGVEFLPEGGLRLRVQ